MLKHVAIAAGIVVLASAFLAPVLDAGFLTDDYQALAIIGADLRHEEGFTAANVGVLVSFFVKAADDRFQLYRPAVLGSFGLNLLGSRGADPAAFQFTNLVLHLLCGLLVYAVAMHLTSGARRPHVGAALASLVFCVSPVQLESVAWSAARSETISLLFGLLAVFLKLRTPDRCLRVSVFFLLALTAKEAALFYVGAFFLIDVFPTLPAPNVSPFADRLRVACRRLLVPMIVIIGYFGLRQILFGTMLQQNYNGVSLGEQLESGPWGRWGRSLLVMIAPVNETLFEGTERHLLTGMAFCGFGGVILGIFGRRGARMGQCALVLVLAVPAFLLTCLLNEVSPKLVHTRNLYLPFAAAMIALAIFAAEGRAWRSALPILLLIVAGVATRPSARLYVEAADSYSATLSSIRGPIEKLEASGDRPKRIAVISYHDVFYFGGAFTMSSALRPSLNRPFTSLDHYVVKVAGAFDAAPRVELSFDGLLDSNMRETAIFKMSSDAKTPTCELVWPGGRNVSNVIQRIPERGAEVIIDKSRPETLNVRFEFDVRDMEPTEVELVLIVPNGRLADPVRLPLGPGRPQGRLVRYGFDLPVPISVADAIDRRTPVAWAITLRDGAGNVLARSACSGLRVRPPGHP